VKDYKPFIGKFYMPPHSCICLVIDIYKQLYQKDLSSDVVLAMEYLRAHMDQVVTPMEGDLILLKGAQWHVGIVVADGEMIHTFPDGSVGLERYDGFIWGNRIRGFFRWK